MTCGGWDWRQALSDAFCMSCRKVKSLRSIQNSTPRTGQHSVRLLGRLHEVGPGGRSARESAPMVFPTELYKSAKNDVGIPLPCFHLQLSLDAQCFGSRQ